MLRVWAIFGVVFQHTLGMFPHPPLGSVASHIFYGMPGLTVLLMLTGFAMRMTNIPRTFASYPGYFRSQALPHFIVYTAFFGIQTGLMFMNGRIGSQFHVIDDFGIATALKSYLLADGYGSLAIWYMQVLALLMCIWPLTHLLNSLNPWFVIVLGMSGSYLLSWGPESICRLAYCMTAVYAGWKIGLHPFAERWQQAGVFGALFLLVTIPFLVLHERGTLPSYEGWFYGSESLSDWRYGTSYLLVTGSRFFGAYFYVALIGYAAIALRGIGPMIATLSRATKGIYLLHRPILMVGLSSWFKPAEWSDESWNFTAIICIALIVALLTTGIAFSLGSHIQRRPVLNRWLFGAQIHASKKQTGNKIKT